MVITVEDILGAAEIGRLLGVSRQRVQQIVSRSDFPAPAKVLAMGKIWLAADVEQWVREHRASLAEAHEPPAPRATKRPRRKG
jgi:predicted DNA-binding transcriptional regulator AlpA